MSSGRSSSRVSTLLIGDHDGCVVELGGGVRRRVERFRRISFAPGKAAFVPIDDKLGALGQPFAPGGRNEREKFVGPPIQALPDPAARRVSMSAN